MSMYAILIEVYVLVGLSVLVVCGVLVGIGVVSKYGFSSAAHDRFGSCPKYISRCQFVTTLLRWVRPDCGRSIKRCLPDRDVRRYGVACRREDLLHYVPIRPSDEHTL